MSRTVRNVLPMVYAIAIVASFLIAPKVGIVVVIVGAMLLGLAYALLSGPRGAEVDETRAERRLRRAQRRA